MQVTPGYPPPSLQEQRDRLSSYGSGSLTASWSGGTEGISGSSGGFYTGSSDLGSSGSTIMGGGEGPGMLPASSSMPTAGTPKAQPATILRSRSCDYHHQQQQQQYHHLDHQQQQQQHHFSTVGGQQQHHPSLRNDWSGSGLDIEVEQRMSPFSMSGATFLASPGYEGSPLSGLESSVSSLYLEGAGGGAGGGCMESSGGYMDAPQGFNSSGMAHRTSLSATPREGRSRPPTQPSSQMMQQSHHPPQHHHQQQQQHHHPQQQQQQQSHQSRFGDRLSINTNLMQDSPGFAHQQSPHSARSPMYRNLGGPHSFTSRAAAAGISATTTTTGGFDRGGAPLMIQIPSSPTVAGPRSTNSGMFPGSGPSSAASPRGGGGVNQPSPRFATLQQFNQQMGGGHQPSPAPSPRHHQQHHHLSSHQFQGGGMMAGGPAGGGPLNRLGVGGRNVIPPLMTGSSNIGGPLRRRPSGLSLYSPSGSTSPLSLAMGFDDYCNSPSPSPRGLSGHMDLETKRCSNAIKKLCSAGNITEVFAVMEEMLSRGLVPDLKTVKTIMRTCVKKLAWRRAIQLLRTEGLPLDVVIFTMAINTCGKAGEWEQGLRVLREMDSDDAKDRGLAPNEVSYGTAISACGKAGRWEIALTLLNEVKERGLVLNDVCYGGAIDACGRAGQWQEALKLLHEMTMEGVAANEVCYNSAISACGKAGEWEKAVSLLREMRERGLTPDELNYNSAISACGKAAQWAHAIRLLREMAVQGLTPDVVSYGAAIDACRKAGKYDKGLALLREMREVGLVPNEVCYHSAVTACSEAGRWSEALFVLSEMVKQGLKPDAISYNAAVEACTKAGKWEALVVLLQETGRDPDATLVEAVFNNAVMTCSKYGNWELAATVLQEMEYRCGAGAGSNALSPTSASYSAVIEACAKALSQGQAEGSQSQWDLILNKLDRMREKGLLPDSTSYNAAVRACVSGPDVKYWKKAVALLQEMAARAYIVDQATSNALMSACCSTESFNTAGGVSSASNEREEAVAILRDLMGGNEDLGGGSIFGGAIDSPSEAGQWEHTLKILAQMAQNDPRSPRAQQQQQQYQAAAASQQQQLRPLTISIPSSNDMGASDIAGPALAAAVFPSPAAGGSPVGSPYDLSVASSSLPSPYQGSPRNALAINGHGPIGSPRQAASLSYLPTGSTGSSGSSLSPVSSPRFMSFSGGGSEMSLDATQCKKLSKVGVGGSGGHVVTTPTPAATAAVVPVGVGGGLEEKEGAAGEAAAAAESKQQEEGGGGREKDSKEETGGGRGEGEQGEAKAGNFAYHFDMEWLDKST